MIIMGIDPGYGIVGYGIIDALDNQKMKVIDYGVITTEKNDSINDRIYQISMAIEILIDKFKPENVAIEELFFHNNAKTAINVAQARGAILLTCTQKLSKDLLFEYTPLQVKQAITSYGRANKQQIQQMVKVYLNLKEIPKPDDAADALAIAITHAQTRKFTKLFKVDR